MLMRNGRIVVPVHHANSVCYLQHAKGIRVSFVRMKRQLRSSYWWIVMDK